MRRIWCVRWGLCTGSARSSTWRRSRFWSCARDAGSSGCGGLNLTSKANLAKRDKWPDPRCGSASRCFGSSARLESTVLDVMNSVEFWFAAERKRRLIGRGARCNGEHGPDLDEQSQFGKWELQQCDEWPDSG